mgnify:CR=1 FL=1
MKVRFNSRNASVVLAAASLGLASVACDHHRFSSMCDRVFECNPAPGDFGLQRFECEDIVDLELSAPVMTMEATEADADACAELLMDIGDADDCALYEEVRANVQSSACGRPFFLESTLF